MPYLGKQSEQVGVSIQKYEFLQATDTSSGTTSFSVPSDAGDHVNVWLNGVLLVEGGSNDYTTTNTTVVFGTAPADGDIIRIDVVESFALPDALKSSGDTMTGALKLDGGIKLQTSQDLSGTYAYHQLMLSDAFTVAGDVTISDNLVLAKLSDDSNAITISNDTSTRTITGTGSLEASTLAQTPNASLTGMTGELGSTVTGSPNLNLTTGTIDTGVTRKVNAFSAYLNSGTAMANNTWLEVSGSPGGTWLERWDTGGKYDPGTGRYTPGVDGIYLVGYSLYFGKLDDGEGINIILTKNGQLSNPHLRGTSIFRGVKDLSNQSLAASASSIFHLDSNDYVSLWVEHQEGGSEALQQHYTNFWGFHVGSLS